MAVNMYWHNAEKDIFIAEYVGRWTWDELFQARAAANVEFDTVTHKVDVIHDWRNSLDFPPNMLGQTRNLMPRMHPNTGNNIMVGTSPLFQAMWKAFSAAYAALVKNRRFYVVNTMDEAHKLIADLRHADAK